MSSWAFVNLKPGTGKTTTSVLLAYSLHARGRSVLLVDADPGESSSRWGELAGGFPFASVTLHKRTIGRDLPGLLARMQVDDVLIDCPQLEDHASIAKGALGFADTWVVPLAPRGIEVDRMAAVSEHFDEVQATRDTDADAVVLFNRTNRRRRTSTGPDAAAREALESLDYTVLETMIPSSDMRYGQVFGVDLTGERDDTVEDLTDELLKRADA